jgi:ERCC4-type nuclease
MNYFIKIDNREKDLIKLIDCKQDKEDNQNKPYKVAYENLDIGDIQIIDMDTNEMLIMIERKTLADLSASIKDGRYKEQKERMIHSLKKSIRKIVLIEGTDFSTFSLSLKIFDSVIINTMIRDNIHIHLTKSLSDTMAFIENIMANLPKYYGDLKEEIVNNINKEYDGEHNCKTGKKDNLTVEMCFRNMLSQITGISTAIAQVIVAKYCTMDSLLFEIKKIGNSEEGESIDGVKELSDLKYGTGQRRIGDKISSKIYEHLTGKPYESHVPIKNKKTRIIKPKKKSDIIDLTTDS